MKTGKLLAAMFVILLTAAPALAVQCRNVAKVDPVSQNVTENTNGSPTTITLNGEPSSPNGQFPLIYFWTQTGGPTVSLMNSDQAKASFSAPDVGPDGAALTFQLQVTACGTTSTTTTTINIANVVTNQPPVAKATVSPDSIYEGTLVTLDGSTSSDPDGNSLTYTWVQVIDPNNPTTPVTITPDITGKSATFTAPPEQYPNGETLTFRLTVFDGTLSNSTDIGVSVLSINLKPVASISCPESGISVNEGVQVTLDGSGSYDPDLGILQYQWIQTLGVPNASLDGVDLTASSITFTAPALTSTPYDTMTFGLTVTDNGNLSSSTTCAVKVLDVTPPVVTVPSNMTAEATKTSGADVTFSASALDLFDGSITPTCLPASGATFSLGGTTVTCSATDKAGNNGSASFTVTVKDTTPPVISTHDDVTAEATSASGAIVTYTNPTATDLVDGSVDVTCSPTSGGTFALGDATVTCNAKDAAGNAATPTTFKVTVKDTTPPVIAVHADLTPVEATSPAGAAVTYTSPATSDAVDGAGIAICLPASGGTFALGDTTVTCNAKDAAGNAATPTTFKVTVKDTTPPVISAHGNETAEATGPTGAIVTYTSPATSDVVDGAKTATCLPLSGGTFALGDTTVTCNAKDAAGNAATPTIFKVTVKDTTPPTLNLPADINTIATGFSTAAASYTATATDLVDGSVPVTCSPAAGTSFPVGATTVNCSATDAHNNKATGSFKVNVSYNWAGFFKPVDMYPMLNVVKAGSAVPVKFNLSGNQGLSIMSPGFPGSYQNTCGSDALADTVEETVTAGSSSLTYDPVADQYIYVWKTDKSWAGTCRQLQVKLKDGKMYWADFKLTK
jgi:HYR domain/REJ domain